MTSRRNVIATALAAPALLAAKLYTSKPKPVTQAELQAVIDAYNEAERLGADIRRRLEAGAAMERGKLGAHNGIQPSLEWFEQNGGLGTYEEVECAGLSVAPVHRMQQAIGLIERSGKYRYWV